MKGESTTRSVAGLAALVEPRGGSSATADAVVPGDENSSTSVPVRRPNRLQTAPPQPLPAAQLLVAAALLGLAVLVGWRIGSVDGLFRVARVDGPSMAPALCGLHYRVTCADCRFPFPCDAVDTPGGGLAVCPNCGYAQNRLDQAPLAPAEEVLIDRWSACRAPERYDIVAAQDVAGGGLIVKRILGLPGERLAIRGGDLYEGERLVRKSLHQLREVRQLVHDNRFQPEPSPQLPPRWQSASATSGWHASGTGFRYKPHASVAGTRSVPATAELDWLEYQHWQCIASPLPRSKLSPVLDNDSYNQAASRKLNAVPDVQLSCRMRVWGQGRLGLAALDGGERFEIVLDIARDGWQGALFADQPNLQNNESKSRKELHSVSVSRFTSASAPLSIEFGLCDQQVLLAIGGRLVVRHPYERHGARNAVLHPLAIGADALQVEVKDLRVWRDQYLLEPLGTPRPWQADSALAADEYALLGDNLTLSTDSRHWTRAGLARRHLLGRVYRPFWAK